MARELMAVFASWVDSRPVELAVDAAYCCDTVIRGLPPNFVLVGAMRLDAALTLAPSPHRSGTRGRPRKRGEPLPKPEKIAQDPSRPWRHCTATLYRGRASKLKYKSFEAQWCRACGERLLRIVIVKLHHGQVPLRILLCADPHADPVHVLQTYAGRWGIEVFFREAKRLLGLADSSARLEAAVRRLAPLIGLLYSLLVLWYLDCPQDPFIRQIPFALGIVTRTESPSRTSCVPLVRLWHAPTFLICSMVPRTCRNTPQRARAGESSSGR